MDTEVSCYNINKKFIYFSPFGNSHKNLGDLSITRDQCRLLLLWGPEAELKKKIEISTINKLENIIYLDLECDIMHFRAI